MATEPLQGPSMAGFVTDDPTPYALECALHRWRYAMSKLPDVPVRVRLGCSRVQAIALDEGWQPGALTRSSDYDQWLQEQARREDLPRAR